MKEPDLSRAELLQIFERCDAASAGPWRSWIEGRDHQSGDSFIGVPGKDDITLSGATHADQDFVAAAREDLPRLAAELLRLKGWAR